jgi:DNA gyrase/topoisomerase IV subunit A
MGRQLRIIDGDAAAAMRYTEARIATSGIELLSDIDRNTVNFTENFDGSLIEPSVLPASLPNLIVNGSSGIAVGMSTSIPPHNMGEVCDALEYMLDRWERLDTVTLPDLMRFIKGPDFPTGGLVFRYSDGPETRLKAHVVVNARGQKRIFIWDIPAPIDRALLVRQIRQMAESLALTDIVDVRDESNEEGRRVVIDLDRAADAEALLETLYLNVGALKTHLVDNLAHAYATGRGKVVVQAKAHIEALDRNRNRIIVTELPYQVNKTTLIERIAELARDQRIEGLTDLRDESDRQGLRIVIDLTRTVDPYDVLSLLYKLTPMRQTFSIIMLALVDDEPRLLSLKAALRVYIEHRLTVVRRRSEYDLERARERAHILEGYLIALDNLDEVIDTIRRSRTVETAHGNLRSASR